MNTPTQQNAKPSSGVDLAALSNILWRGKWIIATITAVCATVTILMAAFLFVPMYPATALVVMETRDQRSFTGLDDIFTSGSTVSRSLNTQIEILQSRELIEQLVDELNLADDPEFGGHDNELGVWSRARFFLSGDAPPTVDAAARRNRAIDTVIARLRVSNVYQSNSFVLSIKTIDPEKSVRILNGLTDLYIRNQIERRLAQAVETVSLLAERTTELQAIVAALEQDLSSQGEASAISGAESIRATIRQLGDLRRDADARRAEIAETETALAELTSAPGDVAALAALEQATVRRFQSAFDRVQSGDLAQSALVAIVTDDLRRDTQQLAILEASIRDLADQLDMQNDASTLVAQLELELDVTRLLYTTFLNRLQGASVQLGLETSDSRVLSEAVVRDTSRLSFRFLALVAGFFGAVMGAVFVMVRELRFSGFLTQADLSDRTDVAVFGSVPSVRATNRQDVMGEVLKQQSSAFTESIRNLRTSIVVADPDHTPQIILVTSSIPGEGKTTLSIALARQFAAVEGKRVLLVEADIRRHTLSAYLKESANKDSQLLDVVRGRVRLDDLDLTNETFGLEVLRGGGDGKINAADLFESSRFASMMQSLRERYDHIIIDSPPVLAVPDSRILSRHADMSLYAVRWKKTTRLQVAQGLEMLTSVGKPASGLVLTQVGEQGRNGYGYDGQYGYEGPYATT